MSHRLTEADLAQADERNALYVEEIRTLRREIRELVGALWELKQRGGFTILGIEDEEQMTDLAERYADWLKEPASQMENAETSEGT